MTIDIEGPQDSSIVPLPWIFTPLSLKGEVRGIGGADNP